MAQSSAHNAPAKNSIICVRGRVCYEYVYIFFLLLFCFVLYGAVPHRQKSKYLKFCTQIRSTDETTNERENSECNVRERPNIKTLHNSRRSSCRLAFQCVCRTIVCRGSVWSVGDRAQNACTYLPT